MSIIYGEFINESTLEESMSSKERNELDDDDFGIPELRKYPIHDKKHVEQAIKMFNHVEKKYESELADNILDAMERYHISTDVVGDKNRLKKYIKEETIYVSEGLIWNDNTPQDIKDLKEDIKEQLKTDPGLKDVFNIVKDTIKNKDFSSDEKNLIYKTLNKLHVKIHGYTLKTAQKASFEITNTYNIVAEYKKYILLMQFIGSRGIVVLGPISIKYDEDKCDIPKNIVFDVISTLSPNVDKVKSTKRSIRISALSNSIDSDYPRIYHKYSNKYNVKKNIGGMSISLSTLKSVKESSPIMGAMPRQDYNPNNVYIINYTKKNTFTEDMAICGDNMSNIFIYDNGNGPKFVSLTDFKEMADNVEVYKFLGEGHFNNILEFTNSEFNFYQNMVSNAKDIKTDPRFIRVPSYIDELNSIEECIINSAPKTDIINEVYCPIIPLINLNESGSSVHYFRDINGVFAQNIDTLNRSASYKSVEDIPETTISILKNI